MNVKAPQTKEEFEAYIRAMDEANEAFFKDCPVAVAEENTEIATRDVPSMEEEDYLFFKSAYETDPVARAAMEAAGITFPDVKMEQKIQERKKKRKSAKTKGK